MTQKDNKWLPEGIIRKSFCILQSSEEVTAADKLWLEQKLKWLHILYDKKDKDKEGDMSWFILKIAMLYKKTLPTEYKADLKRIEIPIKHPIDLSHFIKKSHTLKSSLGGE